MQTIIDYLGFAAAACTTGAFLPQAIKVWRQRAASGISIVMYLILIAGLSLWLCYGIMLRAWPIIVANALTLLQASGILFMKWYFERQQLSREGDAMKTN